MSSVGTLVVTMVAADADVVVAEVTGEVDMATAPQLRAALLDDPGAVQDGVRRVVVDLTAVGFLASSGLAVLAECAKVWGERGVAISVVADSRATLRPIEATGLQSVLDVHPDRASACQG